MAFYALKDWGLQVNDKEYTKKDGTKEKRAVNQALSVGNGFATLKDLTGLMGGVDNSNTGKLISGSQTLKVGLYSVGDAAYAFSSTADTSAPATQTGGWKQIAAGTATTSSWSNGATLQKISLTLASGAAMGLDVSSDKVVSLTGSAGADKVMISEIASTAVLDSFGSGDKIFFSGTAATLKKLNASSGVELLSSADGSKVGGAVVLGAGFSSTVKIDGQTDGSKLAFTLVGDGSTAQSMSIVSSSGTVDVTGSNKGDKVTVKDIVGGTLNIAEKVKTVEAETLTGGTLTISKDATEVSIKEAAGTTVNLKAFKGGTGKIDTISSGKVNATVSGSASTFTTNITGGTGTFVGGTTKASVVAVNGTVLNEATITDGASAAAGLTFGGSKAMSVVASSGAGILNFTGTGADVISIKNLGAAAGVSVGAGSSADTLSIGSFGAKANVTVGDTTNEVIVGSGSNISNLAVSLDGSNVKLVGGSDAVSLVGATVKGAGLNAVGSSKGDFFNIATIDSASKVTLTGGSGDDGYLLASGLTDGRVTITDFGWSTSAEEALNTSLGQDIIYLDDMTASALGGIQLGSGGVKINGALFASSDANATAVYAKIAKTGTAAADAATYRITAGGASKVGSDSPNEVKGSSGVFDASSEEHAYMNLGSGTSTVQNMVAYNGTNDRTASIIDTPMEFADMTQTTDSSGNVTLTDGTNTVKLQELGAGKAIKVGDKSTQEALVLGAATGVTTVEAGVGKESITTNYLGASGLGSIFDFSQTDKTTIDLSGKSTVDGATYKDVKGVIGSDNGNSLLVSGSDAVTLEAAGKGDTLSGAGAGNDTLVSASGKATNFLLSSGNGNDVIKNFQFGDGANADKVIVGASGFDYAESIISASNGKVKVGGENGTLSIDAAGKNYVQIQYNFGGNNPGTAIVDTSESGGVLNFASGSNIILGQSGVTTVKAAAGDDVEPKNNGQPAGIGWNSNYVVANVGVVDVSASDMTAVNGQKNASDMVLAATGASLEGPIWVCGGIGENFSDTGNDTLVASGQGNNEIFVGAKMGNDIIQNVSSKDLITFIDTKVSDFGGVDKVLTIDNTGFTAVFAGTAGTSTTIKGTTQLAMDKTTNLTFHFDDADYVWDGKTLTEATA